MKSALATAAAIRSGETTALAECEAAIARIESGDGAINAVVVRDFDRARAAARAIDAGPQGDMPLLGVPMTVKESYDLAGLPTSWGFEEHRDHVPAVDAVAVQRLKAAGAVVLGKTNVPVALADLQSVNPIYGRTNNPLNHDRVAGGSSGGSAAALAAGFVPLEMGSDIGGSIRVPAAFCGVWGHKPTYGVVPIEGQMMPRSDGARIAMSVVGPMARDADDLAAALDIVSDWPLPRATIPTPGELRVLLLDAHPLAPLDASIAAAIQATGAALEAAGATVARDTPLLPDLAAQQGNYMRMLGITMSRRAPPADRPPASAEDWFVLLDEQARCTRAWQALFEQFDAVIAPSLGMTAFRHPIEQDLRLRTVPINGREEPFGLQFAWPGLATFPGLPATSAPIGRDADGLPIGLQVIAATNRDHTAIAVARMAHELTRELRG